MIEAVAIGSDNAVFSISRGGGVSHVVAHTKGKAVSLYQTPDKLRALWVSPTGGLHAAGKQYHANVGGTWRASKAPATIFALWGVSDDDVFAGGMLGEVLRRRGGAWIELANVEAIVTSIHGLSASAVHFVGDDLNGYFDGTAFHRDALPDGQTSMFMQGIRCVSESETWLCSSEGIYVAKGRGRARQMASAENDEVYGVGLGAGGVFAHRGNDLLRLEGDRLVTAYANDAALLTRQGIYSNCITSNGKRVVAGGVRSVLVEDGAGFVEWPALGGGVATAAKTKAAAKTETKTRPTAKTLAKAAPKTEAAAKTKTRPTAKTLAEAAPKTEAAAKATSKAAAKTTSKTRR